METKNTNPKDAVGVKKVPLHLVPCEVLLETSLAMLEGARKYGAHNYRVSGVRASVYYDAAMRHIMAWWEGEDVDPDSGLPHIIKAIASLVVLRDGQHVGNWVDDRPIRLERGADVKALNELAAKIIERYPECKQPFTHTGDGVLPQPLAAPLTCGKCTKHESNGGIGANSAGGCRCPMTVLADWRCFCPQGARMIRAYLSHPIRGAKGNAATRADMEENNSRAIEFAARVRATFPGLDLYCPGEHDELVQEGIEQGILTAEQSLQVDHFLIARRNLLIVWAPDGRISGGMQQELSTAQAHRIPFVFTTGAMSPIQGALESFLQ